MTRQKKSTTKESKAKVTKDKEFKLTEYNAQNVPEGTETTLEWEGKELQVESGTKLESDKGEGNPLVLRFFDFSANPLAFRDRLPTAQEIFNSHIRGIEMSLWKDGLLIETTLEPRLLLSKAKDHYRIIIGARYNRFKVLKEKPLTLHEIVSSKPTD